MCRLRLLSYGIVQVAEIRDIKLLGKLMSASFV